MKKQLISYLEWKEVTNGTNFLYGTELRFQENGTHLSAQQLASGKAVKVFRSRTNYQAHRRWPELPLLEPGKDYALEVDMDALPIGRYYIQIEFKNRRDDVISSVVLRGNETQFTYPKEAFSYSVKLMSAGCYQMVFRSLSLYQLVEELPSKTAPSRRLGRYEDGQLPQALQFVENLL